VSASGVNVTKLLNLVADAVNIKSLCVCPWQVLSS
jgi:hypothetical protein